MKQRELKCIKVGACQHRRFKAMWLRTDHFLELQESGVLVVGQWCNEITMENLDFCMGCMATWMLNLRSSAPSKKAELTASVFSRKLLVPQGAS